MAGPFVDRPLRAPHRDRLGVFDLGDNFQSGRFASQRQEFQAFFAQALEFVGTRARLERAAAQKRRAGFLDAVSDFEDLVTRFARREGP